MSEKKDLICLWEVLGTSRGVDPPPPFGMDFRILVEQEGLLQILSVDSKYKVKHWTTI